MQLVLKRPIVRTSLADLVYENILESIVSGRLPRGSELNEVGLAEELQVSRTPVHEALRRLAADGLVELLATRRVRVTRFDEAQLIEIYEMRKLLECNAVERAVEHASFEDIARLRADFKALTTSREAEDWLSRAIAFDVAFHLRIAEISDNRQLETEIAKYKRLVQGFCRYTGSAENLWEASLEHGRILDALEARDPVAARRAMEEHIDARLAVVLRVSRNGKD